MRCGECDHDYTQMHIDDNPNFCPDCGAEWREKELIDVDWPITVQAGPRLNILKLVRRETGVEATRANFASDVEVLPDIEVHQDGNFEVVMSE